MTQRESRYSRFSSPYQIRFYSLFRILEQVGYKYYVCRQGDTIEALATTYLYDATYYWVLLAVNRIVDPFKALEVGQRLIIPNVEILEKVND
jgi:hypothetical protein